MQELYFKIPTDHINLGAVLDVESIKVYKGEKCAGKRFLISLRYFGNSGSIAPYLVNGNSKRCLSRILLEQIFCSTLAEIV